MVLVTKCPVCQSVYRVTFPELHLHDGKVRCGQCEQAFNAFRALISIPESLIRMEDSQPALPIHEKIDLPVVNEQHATPSSLQPSERTGLTSAALTDQNTVAEVQLVTRHLIWKQVAASLALLILLCVQLIYFYRTELAIAIPSARSFLEKSCDLLQCEVHLPKYSALLSLESSELRVNPNHQAEIVTLLATIRNHAPFQQAWPELRLTLTDLDDQAIASRILLPSDYLNDNKLPQFFTPDSEIEIKIYFDNSELKAMGYRLELIYL